ncbi:hypothetical protein [Sphingobium sp. MP9-4]|uniref:hypothetical protein n=1 Tax=Sphingobium sp. MP9-4 TaxID=1761936 RepID=UPI0010CA7F83|nr:hypothetical protein [Sphingobium sp. MP9-4]
MENEEISSFHNELDKQTIFGPSHAIRWSWHVRDDVVPCQLPSDQIIGLGGAPIWSGTLLDKASSRADEQAVFGVMVPDFRFGNGICLDPLAQFGSVVRDGFLGIDSRAMTIAHDRAMLDRGMAGMEEWHRRFGKRVRYVLWCLFGRQVHDRMAGKHISTGVYRHPVFNYNDVVNAFPYLDIVDLSSLLKWPIHELRRLYIDSSSHPSQIGYLFLDEVLVNGGDVVKAYEESVAEVEGILHEMANRAHQAKGRKILLTGQSVWLDTFMAYMGSQGVEKLAGAGLIVAPLNATPGQPSINQLSRSMNLDDCAVVVMSAGGIDLSSSLAQAFDTHSDAWRNIRCIDWESATIPAITGRSETPQFTKINLSLPKSDAAIVPDLIPSMVEQGPLGMPSWTGILHILDLIASQNVSTVALSSVRDAPATGPAGAYRVENDVLLTEDGVAFLIGGNHSVLKYATGELTPAQSSLDAFADNMAARQELADRYQIPYAHVIFPDKQSVNPEAFPFQPVHRLGEVYREQLPAPLRNRVLYPADMLHGEADPSFLALDTHLTDHGSLAVLRLMLQMTGIEADHALSRIRRRITKFQRWSGDLGSKFTPALHQEGLLLDPDWQVSDFRSPGGFNDGMVDILLSPDAPDNRTILLFGDSFFRMMLKHISAVFTRVICLRTRFLHEEMIALIRPDIIFTGNAERYLSMVSPDTEAQAFALYPHLRNASDLAFDRPFLDAWAAVTAPRSSHARRFAQQLGILPAR